MKEKLALLGGRPVRKEFLPFHRPSLGIEEEKEMIDTLRSGWLTRGPKTGRFEEDFAKFAQVKYALGLNSCTAALHLALLSLGVGKGDEVITTPFTFAATVNVIVHVGAKPVFVDIDPHTLNIDVTKIERKITSRTKVILPVHFAGQPCDMNAIMRIARKYKLTVIEDAAHAIETVYKGKKVGSIGLMTAFSFYANKNMTTGEGGMLTTNDKRLAQKARILSLHGITADAWQRYGPAGHKGWDIVYPGYKYNMTDIQASLGIHQLKKVNAFWKARKKIVGIYEKALKDIPCVTIFKRDCDKRSRDALHLYIILLRIEDLKVGRDKIIEAARAENIGLSLHYRAIHLQSYYRKNYGFKRGDYPNAEYASDRVISLPLSPSLKESDVYDVSGALKKVINVYRRRS